MNTRGLSILLAGLITSQAEAMPKIRENTEWSQILISNTHQHDKPRVLFIGDSITGAYFSILQSRLADAAYVSEYATSKAIADPDYIKELALVLREGSADIIHLNNGMHGVGYSESQYARGYRAVLDYLSKHTHAKIIVTTTTPRRIPGNETLDNFNPRIIERNRIVTNLAHTRSLLIDDLYNAVLTHPEYCIGDGTHYNSDGINAEALEVETVIRNIIN